MNGKLAAMVVSALVLMMVSPVLQAQSSFSYCFYGEEDLKNYLSRMVPIGEGQEREACYEAKVECEGEQVGGWVEWWVLRFEFPPGSENEIVIPLIEFWAMAGERPNDEYCGNSETGYESFGNVKEWKTTCEFNNGSKFSAKVSEVSMSRCEEYN